MAIAADAHGTAEKLLQSGIVEVILRGLSNNFRRAGLIKGTRTVYRQWKVSRQLLTLEILGTGY